jgi:phage terminase large subunit
MAELAVDFPEKLQFLFVPKRYKVAYGGRGSGKSYNFAQALILLAAQTPMRILCAREVQKSIKQSVHLLLSDQVQRLGLGNFFQVLETEIRGINGSLFMFAGLAQHTVESIKSIEGVDICWIEEGQTVSKKSWDILIPTIRKKSSEIWCSFNPDLDTDETYTRFVLNPPDDSFVVDVNYSDNPYFPEELEKERLHCLKTNPEDYQTIWEGKCRSAVSGAIYASEIDLATRESRICNVPYDPMLKAHTIWDLGFNDSMSILIVQKLRSEIRIIETIEESGKTLDYYAALLNAKGYNWGYDYIPHDGRNKDFKTGKSTEEILKAFGRKPKITPQIGIEPGIKAARMMFRQCYFDRNKSARLIECLKRYRRQENNRTGEFGAPVHDQYSHSADAFRYLGVNAESLTNEERKPAAVAPRREAYDFGAGY